MSIASTCYQHLQAPCQHGQSSHQGMRLFLYNPIRNCLRRDSYKSPPENSWHTKTKVRGTNTHNITLLTILLYVKQLHCSLLCTCNLGNNIHSTCTARIHERHCILNDITPNNPIKHHNNKRKQNKKKNTLIMQSGH